MMMNSDPLITLAEAAAYLRVSKGMMYLMYKEHRGPARVMIGKRAMYLQSDLERFINDNRSMT
jgi:predicted DNA-binding transcriptional regulator AlpA